MANIDTTCKETWVNYFQCKQAAKLTNFVNSLSYGICPEKNVRENIILASLIQVLNRYEVFEDEVTYAYSFTVTNEEEDIAGSLSIVIGGVTVISVAGFTGTSEELAEEIASQFEAYNLVSFDTEIVGSTVYAWSYDAGYNDTTVTTSTGDTYITIEDEDIRDDLDIILDLWNCITFDEFCNIVCFTKKYTNIKCRCSGQ